MSRVCQISGKRRLTGNKVSHSNRKTKRVFQPNLVKKRFFVPETEQWLTLRVSAKILRTINKNGIFATLKKEGKENLLKGK